MSKLPKLQSGSAAPFGMTEKQIASSKALVNRVHEVFEDITSQMNTKDSFLKKPLSGSNSEIHLSGYSSVKLRQDENGDPLFFEATAERGDKYRFDYDTSGWPSPRFTVQENKLRGTVILDSHTHTVDRMLD